MLIPLSAVEGAISVRMLSFSSLLNDINIYNRFFSEVLDINFFLSNYVGPIVLPLMNNIESSNVFEPVGEYAYDSLTTRSVSETLSKYLTNIKYCLNRGIYRNIFIFCIKNQFHNIKLKIN